MVACRSNTMQGVRQLKPDTLAFLLLAAWWVFNLLQAAFTGLADDEAYYWYFSRHLDWGYYDHPPMVALLVALSSWLPGLLGIRFFATLLQPLYLLLFWHLIRPADASRRDALLYVLLCFSQPLLQLYGFMAVPDAPLMMFTVLFFWAYRRFYRDNSFVSALLLGMSVALLGYSKYHGVLVVGLALLANPKLFLRGRLYVAGGVALLLFFPHLWWQYEHDWASFRYHLVGRNAWGYDLSFTLEYLATVAVIFNPLWIVHFIKGLCKPASDEDLTLRRIFIVLFAGFVLFFLVATMRGRVQPQWLLPVSMPVVAMVFHAGRRSRFVHTAAIICVVLFTVVRVVAVINPTHLRGQLWEGDEPYRKLAAVADGRPVEFLGCYSFAAKYAFYTGQPTHCSSFYYSRENQWQYDTLDRTFAGREVVVADLGDLHGESLEVEANRNIKYMVVTDFHPMRELKITCMEPIDFCFPDSLPEFPLTIRVTNPYSYDIVSTEDNPVCISLWFQWGTNTVAAATAPLSDTLHARSERVVRPVMTMSSSVPEGTHLSGLAIGYAAFYPAANSPQYRTSVTRTSGTTTVKGDWKLK